MNEAINRIVFYPETIADERRIYRATPVGLSDSSVILFLHSIAFLLLLVAIHQILKNYMACMFLLEGRLLLLRLTGR